MSRLNMLVRLNRAHTWLPPAFLDTYLGTEPEYIKRSYISISNHFTANIRHVCLLGNPHE